MPKAYSRRSWWSGSSAPPMVPPCPSTWTGCPHRPGRPESRIYGRRTGPNRTGASYCCRLIIDRDRELDGRLRDDASALQFYTRDSFPRRLRVLRGWFYGVFASEKFNARLVVAPVSESPKEIRFEITPSSAIYFFLLTKRNRGWSSTFCTFVSLRKLIIAD